VNSDQQHEVLCLSIRIAEEAYGQEREVGREDAGHLTATFHASVRRACELAQIPRSTYRFERDTQRDEPLRLRLIELAQDKPRCGYRRLWVLLRWEGAEYP
jgi:putative transposase